MINDALLNNKKLSLPNTINIKFQKDLHKYLNSKLYLGLYILFSKQKVDDFWKWIVKIIIKIFSRKMKE